MQTRTLKMVILAAVILAVLVAVIVIAATLDHNNTAGNPTDNGGPIPTHTQPSSQNDAIEGSMGLTDNPFIH